MLSRWTVAVLAVALAAPPAGATVRRIRIEGVVEEIDGLTHILPLEVALDDELALEFIFEDTVADSDPGDPELGIYPIQSLTVYANGSEAVYAGPSGGAGSIAVQTTPGDQAWGVSACAATCTLDETDEARFIVRFADDPLNSDELAPPPEAEVDATIELQLFSSSLVQAEAVTVDILPASITEVPEPAAALSLAAGALVLAAARTRRARAPAPGDRG